MKTSLRPSTTIGDREIILKFVRSGKGIQDLFNEQEKPESSVKTLALEILVEKDDCFYFVSRDMRQQI